MRKILLVSSVLLVTILSAKTLPTENKDRKIEEPKVNQLKTNKSLNSDIEKKTFSVVKVKEVRAIYAQTSCGVMAVTWQDWTEQQHTEWLLRLEENYCKPEPIRHYGPSTNLAGN